MNSIFISYRREDAEGQAGRLYDDLAAEFGRDSVFMDVAVINPGLDFRKAVDQGLSSCSVFLAVIGKNWLTAADSSGKRRLDDPVDFVRLETAEALKRGNIPLIPVLVQGASMPRADDLPDDLKDLAYRNAVEISHARWSSDMGVLIKALQSHLRSESAPPSRQPESHSPAPKPSSPSYGKWFLFVSGTALLAISGFYVIHRYITPSTQTDSHAPTYPVPDLSGVWLQTNPQTNVDKPAPPIRLRITQRGSEIASEISYTDTFSGRVFGKGQIKNGRAEWTEVGGCGGSSTFLIYLRGDILIYKVTDTFPVPCGGHPAGVEHRPVAELQRINR